MFMNVSTLDILDYRYNTNLLDRRFLYRILIRIFFVSIYI